MARTPFLVDKSSLFPFDSTTLDQGSRCYNRPQAWCTAFGVPPCACSGSRPWERAATIPSSTCWEEPRGWCLDLRPFERFNPRVAPEFRATPGLDCHHPSSTLGIARGMPKKPKRKLNNKVRLSRSWCSPYRLGLVLLRPHRMEGILVLWYRK